MGLGELTRQASGFLRDKYQTAKLFLADVSPAESMAEEAINGDSLGLDPRTMMKISEAAFDVDDYWRILDLLHRRFDWGSSMRRKSEAVTKLLTNERFFREARWKALRISKEIQGFGSTSSSPASSPTFSSSKTSRSSSFGSCSRSSVTSDPLPTASTTTPRESPRGHHERSLQELARRLTAASTSTQLRVVDHKEGSEIPHSWVDTATSETGSFLDAVEEDGGGESAAGFLLRSFSNAADEVAKKKVVERQLSSAF